MTAADLPSLGAPLLSGPAPGAGRGLAILLHGLGHDEAIVHTMLGPALPADLTCAAYPAPLPGPAATGGRAWYEVTFTPGGPVMRLDQEAASRAALLAEAEALAAAGGPLLLLGFGQGGVMALGMVLERPDLFAGCAVAGARVLDSAAAAFQPREQHRGKPLFWGHGRADAAIPFDAAGKGRDLLDQYGFRLSTFDHAGGHETPPELTQALRTWIEERLR